MSRASSPLIFCVIINCHFFRNCRLKRLKQKKYAFYVFYKHAYVKANKKQPQIPHIYLGYKTINLRFERLICKRGCVCQRNKKRRRKREHSQFTPVTNERLWLVGLLVIGCQPSRKRGCRAIHSSWCCTTEKKRSCLFVFAIRAKNSIQFVKYGSLKLWLRAD